MVVYPGGSSHRTLPGDDLTLKIYVGKSQITKLTRSIFSYGQAQEGATFGWRATFGPRGPIFVALK